MDPIVLKQVILEQAQVRLPEDYVPRAIMPHIQQMAQTGQVVVLTGLRRVGKSTLMQVLRQSSEKADYYLNFDDDRLVQFALEDFQVLLELFLEIYGEEDTFYFDEIQNIPEWERFIRRLHDNGKRIFVTGSNAALFSKELGTRLTGRYLQIEVLPFSFQEFLYYQKVDIPPLDRITTVKKAEIKKQFHLFYQMGGIPQYIRTQEMTLLQGLYESVIYRDIIARYRLSNEKPIKELVYYLASNLSKDVSFNALRKLLKLGSATTVSEYCHYLANSYLCFFINRYDVSLKKQILSSKKVYFIDAGLAQSVGFRFSEDKGRLLENMIYLALRRFHGPEIYFYRENKECDFLLRKGMHIIAALQVCVSLKEAKTKRREMEGLIAAMQAFGLSEGWILTEDETGDEIVQQDGKSYQIKVRPIWDWLLSL